jgi:hypothetical protein
MLPRAKISDVPRHIARSFARQVVTVLVKGKNLIRFIKSQRLKWLGHVERMPNEREVTRIYKWKPLASRAKGRPKNRWEGDVRTDLQKMKIKNWKRSVLYRDSWRTIERTKTHKEL